MEWIANQPVSFSSDLLCNSCDEDIPQLSDNTDTVQVQFKVDTFGGLQLMQPFINHLTNDWVLQDGWAINGGKLCLSGIEPGAAFQTFPIATFPTGYYVFTVDVKDFSGNAVPVVVGNNVDGNITIGSINRAGIFNFYYHLTAATDDLNPNRFIFVPGEQGSSLCITLVTAYKILTDAKVAVYNDLGVYVTEIGYVANPLLFKFYENTVTVTIKWSILPVPISNGCYYLCFLDPCLNSGGQNYVPVILNQGFAFGGAWVLVDVTQSAGKILFAGVGTLSQANVFAGLIYNCVKIKVDVIQGSLAVYFGTALVGTITTVGIHTICGIPVGNLGITIISSGAIGDNATVDYVQPMQAVLPVNYTCNLKSNSFKIDDYTNACTLLISALNRENGLGFVFAPALPFIPKIRLEAKLKGLKYQSERSINEDSLGLKNVYYFSGRKAKVLAIDLQPEYVHDFLRLLIGFDNWFIDGVLYFVDDDEYSVAINEVHDSVGSVKLLVSTRTQNVKNFNCQ